MNTTRKAVFNFSIHDASETPFVLSKFLLQFHPEFRFGSIPSFFLFLREKKKKYQWQSHVMAKFNHSLFFSPSNMALPLVHPLSK